MVKINDFYIDPTQIVYAHDAPEVDYLRLHFRGGQQLALRDEDRRKMLVVLRAESKEVL